jgi:hypothetical protein
VDDVGFADAAAESFGQQVVFDLLAAGFATAVPVRVHLHERALAEIEDVIEADGEGAASRRAARFMACWVMAMRSTAKSSWELA